MKRKYWILLALVVAVLLLSGCGVPREGVDVYKTDPSGFWQILVVWPLAKSLLWLAAQNAVCEQADRCWALASALVA